MIKKRLIALTLVTFLTMAVVSGGATVAVLSDSHTVTAELPATTAESGNVAASTTLTSTPTPTGHNTSEMECGIGETQHSGTDNGDTENISILLKSLESGSANQQITAGEKTTYYVAVENATNNITAYNLKFALCDSSVAIFENFTHRHDPESHQETVTEDKIDVSAGVSDPNGIEGSSTIYLGTITVIGNSSGQTALGIVNVDDGNVRIIDDRPEPYNITSTGTGVLTVDEADEENETES